MTNNIINMEYDEESNGYLARDMARNSNDMSDKLYEPPSRGLFGGWSSSSITDEHPVEAIARYLSPESAALMYAHKSNWLTPELMPLINNFLNLKTLEKITLCEEITKRSGISADERKHLREQLTKQYEIQTDKEKNQTSEYEETKREGIRTNGYVEGERIRGDTTKFGQSERTKRTDLVSKAYSDVGTQKNNVALEKAKMENLREIFISKDKTEAIKYSFDSAERINEARNKTYATINTMVCETKKYLSDNKKQIALHLAQHKENLAEIEAKSKIDLAEISLRSQEMNNSASIKLEEIKSEYEYKRAYLGSIPSMISAMGSSSQKRVRVTANTENKPLEIIIDAEYNAQK